MCWNKWKLYWKITKLFYFCHLKEMVRPETFGPTVVLLVHVGLRNSANNFSNFRDQDSKWYLCFSGMLRSEVWLLFTDVSGQSVCPIFNCQTVQEERILPDCLTLEDWISRVSRNASIRCLTSPENEDLIYTAVETRNHPGFELLYCV